MSTITIPRPDVSTEQVSATQAGAAPAREVTSGPGRFRACQQPGETLSSKQGGGIHALPLWHDRLTTRSGARWCRLKRRVFSGRVPAPYQYQQRGGA